ncbi:hypothetical protein JZX87_11390 [Agrobacterium sp. Ap1]|uniref:hypothetical protein n=1 Tax=Agrobacterium sp. Ap1 TaxID=2815337 RepID=UPI001A8E37D9|nr:hypothetical protein [Agrobacterium sp. Ap1]MBO0141763.1 hypothetical protein [Agrobacterium sp. Ap1]
MQADLARLPVLVAAFLIALFGMLAGSPRNAEIATSARPVDDRSDRSPVLTKREPLRAVSIAERKDGAGTHASTDEGLPAPQFFALPTVAYTAARAPGHNNAVIADDDWPSTLPRAPPVVSA